MEELRPGEFWDFYQKHKGFVNVLYNALEEDADVYSAVKGDLQDLYTRVLSKFPFASTLRILIDDVIFTVEKLPFTEKKIDVSKGCFEVKLPYLNKRIHATWDLIFKNTDKEILGRIWDRLNATRLPTEEITQSNEDTIARVIQERNSALESLVTAPCEGFLAADDTIFLVARHWNSWAPSFFEVPGGCYAIIPPRASEGESNTKKKVIVIDPGFRFLKVLKENWRIGVPQIGSVIVSHFHPDHVGGLFEYIALQYTHYQQTGVKSTLYLNPTCRQVFGDLSPAIEVRTIDDGDEFAVIEDMQRNDGLLENVSAKAFRTHHWELGHENKSLGFIISIETRAKEPYKCPTSRYLGTKRVAILGDTAYSPDFAKRIYSSDVLVLHLGSFQMKESRGKAKHLYAKGLLDLLKDCGTWIRQSSREPRKKVLISELGLEHANSSYIKHCLGEATIKDIHLLLDDDSNYLEIITEFLNKEVKEWADVYVETYGVKVHFGENVRVEPANTA
jgi:ribonuclease BN (tRNA processing enzyme)